MRILTVVNPRAVLKQWNRLGDLAVSQLLTREIGKKLGRSNNIIITGHIEGTTEDEYQTKEANLRAIIDRSFITPDVSKHLSQKEYYKHIRSKVEEYKPDVIHIQQAQVAASSYISELATSTDTPVVWTLHNPPEGRATYQYADAYRSILANPLCRLVCVSNSARDRLMNTLKVSSVPDNLRVIYNGIDYPDIDVDKFTYRNYDLVGIGRIDPPKNTEALIDYMILHPELNCLYIGDTFSTYETKDSYAISCKMKLQSAPNIRWIPSATREEIYYYLLHAKYYITFSRVETFSLTSCEAMSVGTPVICFNEAGPGEIVPSYAGIKIDPVPRRKMTSYMLDLNARLSEDQYTYSRQKISNYARSTFSSSTMYDNYLKLYKEMTQS